MKVFVFFLSLCFSIAAISPAFALSTRKEAEYMALLYAVLNKKMKDADIAKDLDALRADKQFVSDMSEKLDNLTNDRYGNSKDRKIRSILEKAGKDIDKYL